MTDKEIARFKVKFPKLNLSSARLAAYKLSLADDADEAAIDAKLDEVNGIYPFEEVAKADDRARTVPPKPAPVPTPDPAPANPVPVPDDMPAWAKTLMTTLSAKVDAVTSEVSTMKAEKSTLSRKQQLEAALTESGASDAFKKVSLKSFDLINFDTDEKFSTYLEGIKTDAADFVQTEANNGLRGVARPIQPAGANPAKLASKEDLDAVMTKL